jgi:hypothetical protein
LVADVMLMSAPSACPRIRLRADKTERDQMGYERKCNTNYEVMPER